MDKFFAAVRNMFNVPDLRRRILFTLGMLAVYRLGRTHWCARNQQGSAGCGLARRGGNAAGRVGSFLGRKLPHDFDFALGVTPYITASIILQLMTVVHRRSLKKLQEEGEMGRQKINQWTRYLTVGLAGYSDFVCCALAAGKRRRAPIPGDFC